MGSCRCEMLNVMSGAVASDYARDHLDEVRSGGRGRKVFRCPDTGVTWMQDIAASGYDADSIVLRRSPR